jgi:hypothetical protein
MIEVEFTKDYATYKGSIAKFNLDLAYQLSVEKVAKRRK